MSLADRKYSELTYKLESLTQELTDWEKRSEVHKPLQKHYTQIRRLRTVLDRVQEGIRAQFPGKDDPMTALANCRRLEHMILEAHRLWEFFRSKLALRDVQWFRPYLVAADEFVWECYKPVRDRLDPTHIPPEAVKEPPLVFFNGIASPFAQPRNRAYQLSELPGTSRITPAVISALQQLPVSVLGIPWFQMQHLPDMLMLGHETGHCVEYDFALTARLRALVRSCNISESRHNAWMSWLSEVFADQFGVLACGPAFVGSLMDFLALDRQSVEKEKRLASNWTTYPSSYLRILLCLQALRHLKYPEEMVAKVQSDWTETYPSHSMQNFEEDIPRIVRALLEGPYPELSGITLREALSFSPIYHQRAQTAANVIGHSANQEITEKEVRILLPAARLAYAENRDTYQTYNVSKRVLDGIQKSQTDNTRGTTTTRGTKIMADRRPTDQQNKQSEHDNAMGLDMLALICPPDKKRASRQASGGNTP